MTRNADTSLESKELLAGIGLAIVIVSFLLYLYEYEVWINGLRQLIEWLLRPDISYTPISLDGTHLAILGIFEILTLGVLGTHLLLPDEEDLWIRWLSAFGLGVGLSALLTAVLATSQALSKMSLNVFIVVLISALFALDYRFRGRRWLSHFAEYWGIRKIMKNRWIHRTLVNPCRLLPVLGITVILFLVFYNALLSYIDHFDALIYHVGMAKIMFQYHGIPFIAGPSPGIEMSANYPPLYPSLGAFFFVQMGKTVVDLPLRAISPFMGFFTLIATYKLGQNLLGRKNDLLVPIVLIATPLFILYSIHALNNMMTTFFLALAALNIVAAFDRRYRLHLLVAGLFFGFATSTSYLALYFVPAFLLVTILFTWRANMRWLVMILSFFAGTALTGAFWYLRNLIVLRNPIWPIAYSMLGGSFIDPVMETQALQSIHDVGIFVSFGKEPGILDWFHLTFLGRAGFPTLSILTATGVICAVVSRSDSRKWVAPAMAFIPLVLMASSFAFFTRYFVLILPFAAILSASTFSYIFMSRRRSMRILGVLVLATVLVYPGVTAAASGKMYHDVVSWEPPKDFLWYLRNPGIDFLTSMVRVEGERVEAWSWLNENLKIDEKVATYESRVYYIKEGGVHHFFFLDGWEARPLFSMFDKPDQMITYLRGEKVKYVFILQGIVSVGVETLPLTGFLGTPYFPLIYEKGDARIYNVGPLSDLMLYGEIPARINDDGWTEIRAVAGHLSRSVVEGDVRPRLFAATPDAVMVNITYLDEGAGSLEVNLYYPDVGTWLFGLATINKAGTGEWKSYNFIIPRDLNRHFVELGLHASQTDFTISEIAITKLNLAGCSSDLSLTRAISNRTELPSLMVYPPLMEGCEKLMISTNSYGKNISVEIFDGVIQPREVTKWWETHSMILRSPDLPTFGVPNPTLSWNAEAGAYTVVLVLWDEYEPDTEVDFSIAIGGGR